MIKQIQDEMAQNKAKKLNFNSLIDRFQIKDFSHLEE